VLPFFKVKCVFFLSRFVLMRFIFSLFFTQFLASVLAYNLNHCSRVSSAFNGVWYTIKPVYAGSLPLGDAFKKGETH
jgi:hypothetical protein